MGGPVLGIVASLVGSIASAALAPKPPSPPAPIAPPPPPTPPSTEPTKEPEGALDAEAAKQRALKRRRAGQTSGLSLLEGGETGTTETKTLVGE